MMGADEAGGRAQRDELARTRLAAALDQPGIVAAVLFGSYSTGTAGPLSDVDVAVWLDPGLASDERLDARLRLTEAAGRALEGDVEIDLVVLNDASPLLCQRVRQTGAVLIERDPRSRIRLESRALVEYLDTEPLRHELARGTRDRLAEGRFGR